MPYSPLSYALYLLKNRAQTRQQLIEKLTRKKYPPEKVGEALKELERLGLINDEQFAHNYTRDKVNIYRRGPWRIGRELAQKGVDKELIDKALKDISSTDELLAAQGLINGRLRTWKDLDPRKRYLRAVSLLSRRGFSSSVIKQVISEHIDL